MSTLVTVLRRGARRVSKTGTAGTSAVEYSLLVVSIAAVCAAIIFSVGVKLKATFDDTCRALATAQQQPAPKKGAAQAVAKLHPDNIEQCG